MMASDMVNREEMRDDAAEKRCCKRKRGDYVCLYVYYPY